MTDAELVARALEGSEEAYREIVLRYQRPVFSLVVRMVRDQELAEDLAQEAFIKAFRALRRYDPSRKFSSWLFKIAHNATIDHLRRQRLDIDSLDDRADPDGRALGERLEDEGTPAPDQRVHRRDVAAALEEAIAALRPEYREVILLRFVEGLAYQEIADILELPLGTVKTNIHRARKELAASLGGGWSAAARGVQNRETDPEEGA
ncbi:MAG TPA: sigma-70 family RNA polymerase sigma factor [Thermoanaerobaculia bacterium]|nr:sigma-70 family RNA polymerase sigma factor [Thermoanaerobaculia bacterium]